MPAPRTTTTKAIVLRRVNYGEADRILTLLTPDQGKLSAIAKGTRKARSKLAGGIELLSIGEVSFIKGKNDIDTLTSTRLMEHFGKIVQDMERTNFAYEFIKTIDKITEDNPEIGYFSLLAESLRALNDAAISSSLTKLWFSLHLLKLTGHAPDLFLNEDGKKLSPAATYNFDIDRMRFVTPTSGQGLFGANHIKLLRLAANAERPHLLARVNNGKPLISQLEDIVISMLQNQIHA